MSFLNNRGQPLSGDNESIKDESESSEPREVCRLEGEITHMIAFEKKMM